jgi:carboxypeptidase Q
MLRSWFMRLPILVFAATALFAATPLNETYKVTADRIIDAAMADDGAYRKLSYLCDRIGNRLAGSENLNEAVRWAADEMRRDGLKNVATPEVMVPVWKRGPERLNMLAPVQRALPMLGLGGSIATPLGGITAEVVSVASFAELEALGAANVKGKIVLYNVPWAGYGRTVAYRMNGASRAAKFGAVAALVRSVTPVSLETPHTGMMSYSDGLPKIPAAAVAIETATMIDRLLKAGNVVRLDLQMSGETRPDAPSANVIGEIPGSEHPEEVVVIGGHIDSWDVGQGAHDDGAGIVTAMQAAAVIKRLGLTPRRTIRVVLFTNEENGGAGGIAYRAWVGDKVKQHVAAIEMDGGGETPLGFGVAASLLPRAREIGKLLERIGAGEMTSGGGGADIGPIVREGVPALSVRTTGTHYFDWHHTAADTADKVDPKDLKLNTAAMAVMTYILADMQ